MQALRADYIKPDRAILRQRRASEARTALDEHLQTLVAVIRLGADFAKGFGVYGSAPIRASLKR